MNNSLFEPSLKEQNWSEVKSYEIAKLFYVAFIGGLLPIMIIGNRNAHWLKVDKFKVNLMLALGVVFLIIKMAFIGWYFRNGFSWAELQEVSRIREIKWGFRVASLLVFLGYYRVMKDKYIQFLATDGEPKPLLRDAVIWIAIGGIIEFCLWILGGFIFSYVF